jgi:hypothetical protein
MDGAPSAEELHHLRHDIGMDREAIAAHSGVNVSRVNVGSRS